MKHSLPVRRSIRRLLSVCLAVILASATLLSVLSMSGCALLKRENTIIYLSKGKYKAVTSMGNGKNAVLADADFDYEDARNYLSWYVTFSESGDAFYLTGEDEDLTLNMAPISKMDQRHLKKGKLGEEVCSGVGWSTTTPYGFSDHTVVFRDQNGYPCYYDGKDVSELYGGLANFLCDEQKNCLIFATEQNINVLYRVTNCDPSTLEKVADNCANAFLLAGKGENGARTLIIERSAGSYGIVKTDSSSVENFSGAQSFGVIGDNFYYLESTSGSFGSFPLFNLCGIDYSGKKTVYKEGVVFARKDVNCIVFNTEESLASIYNIPSAYPGGLIDGHRNLVFLPDSGKIVQLDDATASRARGFASGEGCQFIGVGSTVYLHQGSRGNLYYLKLDEAGANVTEPMFLANESKPIGYSGDILYYETDYNGNYCSIYSSDKGDLHYHAKDLNTMRYTVCPDGTVVGYTDRNCTTLTLFIAGQPKKLAEDVTMYIKAGFDEVIYISDDDLFFYDGSRKNKLDTDVDYVWSSKVQETIKRFY